MNFSLLILICAYFLHMIEEYKCGWLKWARSLSGLAIREIEFIIVNALVLIIGISCTIIGYSCPIISLSFAGLVLVNALFAHIGTTIVKHIYSPGTITSIFLFLPLGIWVYYDSIARNIISVYAVFITLIIGFAMMSVPIIFQIIKSKK